MKGVLRRSVQWPRWKRCWLCVPLTRTSSHVLWSSTCHPTDGKPKINRLGPSPGRIVQGRKRISAWLDAQNMCGDMGRWRVARKIDVSRVYSTSEEGWHCGNYRTIALVLHDSKVLLRIILGRIRFQTETEIANEHAGFRQGRGPEPDYESQDLDAKSTWRSATFGYVLHWFQEGFDFRKGIQL